MTTSTIKASGANSILWIAPETSYGVVNAAATWTRIPFSTLDGELVLTDFDDNTITGTRQGMPSVTGTHAATMTLAVNYGPVNFAILDALAFCNTATAGVLTTGTTVNSITVIWQQTDTGVIQQFTGVLVNKRSIKVPVKGVVTCSYDMVGQEVQVLGAFPTGTQAAFTKNPAYSHTTATGYIQDGSGNAIGYLSDLQIDQDNQFTANDVLFKATPDGYTYGDSKVSGSGTAYFVDATLFNNFKNNVHTTYDLKLVSGAHSDEIYLKDVKIDTFKPSVKNSGVISVAITWTAFGDPAGTYTDIKQTSV